MLVQLLSAVGCPAAPPPPKLLLPDMEEAELGMNRLRREMALEGVEEARPLLPVGDRKELKGDSWGERRDGEGSCYC